MIKYNLHRSFEEISEAEVQQILQGTSNLLVCKSNGLIKSTKSFQNLA